MGRIKLPSGMIFRQRAKAPGIDWAKPKDIGPQEIGMALKVGEMIYKSPLLRDAVGGVEQLFKEEGPTKEVLAEAAKVRQAATDRSRAEDKIALVQQERLAEEAEDQRIGFKQELTMPTQIGDLQIEPELLETITPAPSAPIPSVPSVATEDVYPPGQRPRPRRRKGGGMDPSAPPVQPLEPGGGLVGYPELIIPPTQPVLEVETLEAPSLVMPESLRPRQYEYAPPPEPVPAPFEAQYAPIAGELADYEARVPDVTQETLNRYWVALNPDTQEKILAQDNPAKTLELFYKTIYRAAPPQPQPVSFNVKGLEPVEAITVAFQLGANEGSIDDLRTMLKDVGDIKGTTSSWAAAGGTAGFIPKDVQAQQMFSAYLKGVGQTRDLTNRELKLAMALNKQGLKFDKFALAQQREKRLDISAKDKRAIGWQKLQIQKDRLALAKKKAITTARNRYNRSSKGERALNQWRKDLIRKQNNDDQKYGQERTRLQSEMKRIQDGLGRVIQGAATELRSLDPTAIAHRYATRADFKKAVQKAVIADRKAEKDINVYDAAIERTNAALLKLDGMQEESNAIWSELVTDDGWQNLSGNPKAKKELLIEVGKRIKALQAQKLE